MTYILPAFLVCMVLAWASVDLPCEDAFASQSPVYTIAGDQDDPVVSWKDFWATGDPFVDYGLRTAAASPNGRRFSMESNRITNRRSFLRDHSIYGENPEEFVAPLADHLLLETDATWTMFPNPSAEKNLMNAAQGWRRTRVNVLGASFWLALLVPIMFNRAWFRDTYGPLLFERNGSQLRYLPGGWEWVAELNQSPDIIATVVGVLVTVAAAILWYNLASYTTWRSWDRAVERDLFERKSRPSLNSLMRGFAFICTGLLLPFLILSYVLARSRGDTWIL